MNGRPGFPGAGGRLPSCTAWAGLCLIFIHSFNKRSITESMAAVGIETNPNDIVYAPVPGDTRAGFVTVHLVAKITESAQLNAKKVWASHPLGRNEAVAIPDIGVFTINGVTNSEMSRLPFAIALPREPCRPDGKREAFLERGLRCPFPARVLLPQIHRECCHLHSALCRNEVSSCACP